MGGRDQKEVKNWEKIEWFCYPVFDKAFILLLSNVLPDLYEHDMHLFFV